MSLCAVFPCRWCRLSMGGYFRRSSPWIRLKISAWFHSVQPCVVLIVFPYRATESCSDCNYNFIQQGSTFFSPPYQLKTVWYLCFCRRRTDGRLHPSWGLGWYPSLKFQFNISDISSALMINFFVCVFFLWVSCRQSSSPQLPTPTHSSTLLLK